jgi:NAD(P)-dependent dehydrogenase (short-subunit alcohol dehydrogenase family)
MKKTILITGASRGFGRLASIRLAKEGWQVFATMRELDKQDELLAAARSAGAPASAIEVVKLDVLDLEDVHKTVTGVVERAGGTLDAALCNAGIAVAGAFEDCSPKVFRRVMDTNLIGLVETTRAALPGLRASGDGRLVLMSSDSGLYGTPALAAYTASKFAVEGFGEALAYEVQPLGVSVSMIEPGAFATDIWSAQLHADPQGPYGEFAEIMQQAVDKIGSKAPAPDPVIDLIVKVLAAKKPKLRYPIGADAKIMSAAKGVLPDRLRASLLRQQTGIGQWTR